MTNAYAEYTFIGTSVSWIARKNQYTGIIGVYIDGVFQQNVDLYSSSTAYQQTVYTKTGLTNESHTTLSL